MTIINTVLKNDSNKKYGASVASFLGDVDSNGILQSASELTNLVFKGVKDIGSINAQNGVLLRRFQFTPSIKTVSFPNLEKISYPYALYDAFYGCSSLANADFSSLTTVTRNNAIQYAFYNCSSLTSVDFSSLTTVSGDEAFNGAFNGCSSLTNADFSSLTTVTGNNALIYIFYNCSSLTSVDFSSLTTVTGNNALYSAFYGCSSLTNIYFNSLTSTSFGSFKSQFATMLTGCSGVTVHFPSNLDPQGGSTVISSLSGYPNFGGTNTVLAFDLPPTT